MTVTAGSPRARTLGAELRKARERASVTRGDGSPARMTVRELASRIGVSHASLSKWENGHVVPDAEQVVAFLQECGVTGEQRERVLMLVRGTTDPNWLTGGIPGVSQGLAGVLECERTAIEMIEWQPLIVPGLLQTPDTARVILGSDETLTPRELDGLVSLRMGRREFLTKARNEEANLGPIDYTALIGEHALREGVGSARVTADQLRYLLELCALPAVTVQVVPAGTGWHPGLPGPFILYRFTDSDPIVVLEHLSTTAFLYDDKDITAYKTATTKIRNRALAQEATSELIAQMLAELEDEG